LINLFKILVFKKVNQAFHCVKIKILVKIRQNLRINQASF